MECREQGPKVARLVSRCPTEEAPQGWRSGKHESPFGFGDGAAEFAGGFDPFLDDHAGMGERFFIGCAVGHAAGQFRHFNDEGLIFLAPVDNQLVFNRHRPLPSRSEREPSESVLPGRLSRGFLSAADQERLRLPCGF